MRVGFIGLGSQGGPMARRIVEGGYDLTLWARRPATLEPFADTAAKTARFTGRVGGRQRPGLPVRRRRRRRQGSARRRQRRAGRAGAGRDRRHPQHRASRHVPRDRRIGCRTRCFGDRRAGERRRACRRGGRAAGHGRRRRGGRRALPSGVRDIRRPDRAPRPAGQRPGHQDPEQPAVHRQPGQRDQHARTGRIPWHRPRSGSARSSPRGSATSKALGSIAAFGGTPGPTRVHRRCAAAEGRPARREHRRQRVGTPGRGVRRRRCRADGRWTIRDDAGRLRRHRAHGRTRWCAGWSTPVTTSARWAARAEKCERSANSGAIAVTEPADVAEGADVVIVCVFTDEQVRQVCLEERPASPPWRRTPCSSFTPREARAPPRRSPPPRRRRGRRSGQRRSTRHRRGPGDAVRRGRRRRCGARASAAEPPTLTRSCMSAAPARASW